MACKSRSQYYVTSVFQNYTSYLVPISIYIPQYASLQVQVAKLVKQHGKPKIFGGFDEKVISKNDGIGR